jgi:diacylglycerol O-acyltransferase
MFNLVVTNVPGPQFPLYAGGALMLGAYPVVPLAKGQAVAIGLTSYDGGVYFGLNADRDAMTDVDVLAECLETSLQALLDTVPRRSRGSKPRASATGPAASVPSAPATTAPATKTPATKTSKSKTPATKTPATKTPATRTGADDDAPAATSVRPKQVSSAASRGLVSRPVPKPAARPSGTDPA